METPAGAQAQVDWAIFPGVTIVGARVDLNALLLNLSFSRYAVMNWSYRRDQLSWISGHNALFRRIAGVPAVIRIDNDAAAVARGAGPWGVISEPYRRYAMTMRFHVDLCLPRQPQAKGKVERRVRSHRQCVDPYREHWRDLGELQAHTDEVLARDAMRRRCPITGTSVAEAFAGEQAALAPLPGILPEPFDAIATRTVSDDGLIAFEGRQYSVPFAYVGQSVEARGCAGKVQILAGPCIVAQHDRHTARRILIDPGHYDGPSTERVLAPPPLGRMGQRLLELASVPVEHRGLDLYAFLTEGAR